MSNELRFLACRDGAAKLDVSQCCWSLLACKLQSCVQWVCSEVSGDLDTQLSRRTSPMARIELCDGINCKWLHSFSERTIQVKRIDWLILCDCLKVLRPVAREERKEGIHSCSSGGVMSLLVNDD